MSAIHSDKRIFGHRSWLIIVGLLLVAVVAFNLVKETINRYRIDRQVNDLNNQIKDLQQQNSELNNLISSWSGSNQLEKEARLKQGLQKPGERVVLILRQNTSTSSGSNLELLTPAAEPSNPQKWWRYFFGNK